MEGFSLPDWSYHVLFKPILKQLSPYHSREFIHRGMNIIASMPLGKHVINFLGREESSTLLKKEIQKIQFPNSIGFSGKVDPLLSGTKAFSNLGFGFLEIGPITKVKVEGVPPTINHQNQIIEYPNQMESIGLEQTITKLKNSTFKQPLMMRLSGSFEDLSEMLISLQSYADAFIISFTDDFERMTLMKTITKKPVFLSVPVNKIKEIPLEKIQSFFSGIVLEEEPNQTDETNLANHLDAISYLRKDHFTKTILTVGGVSEPADALKLFDSSADLILLSGGYVFSGPGLPKRIKEAQLNRIEEKEVQHPGWGWYFLFGLSIFIGGIIALLISMSSIMLSYDENFLGITREMVATFNKRVLYFMGHDRTTLAGTMISGGIIYLFLAKYGIRKGILWAKQATDIAAILGFLGIFLFIGYGYFDWLHLIFYLILFPFYFMGFIKSRNIKGTPSSTNLRNHQEWKRSLIGQLLFVILGFCFVVGGIVISIIGISTVFVETDLHYLSMGHDALHSFNERLIPVIAHDRAGFGTALLSVGLLVLMVSLWGFHQGKRWVWWTLFLGGIPAFTSGIGVHFAIGYKNFIHLLPAYFALVLYILGLITTYPFFFKQKDTE
jgi:dihydroorotate dehydrogenase